MKMHEWNELCYGWFDFLAGVLSHHHFNCYADKSCGIRDIKTYSSHVTKYDHVIKGSCDKEK